eukprot:gene4821-8407_t
MTIFVGLTGGISCGKSTVSSILEKNGCIIIDFDKIAKQALEVGETPYESTVNYFQNEYKDVNGNSVNILKEDCKNIDRTILGSIVFSDKAARKKLQSFTDQWCFWKISKEIYSHYSLFSNDKIVILDAPLLYETKVFSYITSCNIVVVLNYETQLKRLMERNELSKEEAENRIKSQMSTKEKIEKSQFVIENEGDLENLEKKTLYILGCIKSGVFKEEYIPDKIKF